MSLVEKIIVASTFQQARLVAKERGYRAVQWRFAHDEKLLQGINDLSRVVKVLPVLGDLTPAQRYIANLPEGTLDEVWT